MAATTLLPTRSAPTGAFRCRATLVVGILSITLSQMEGAAIDARSASRVDVGAAVTLAKDGDTVRVPAGIAIWTTTLNVTKNISIIGAGEGQTIITENVGRSGGPPLIGVNLSHESAAPNYSFRLSGFTFKSAAGTSTLPVDHAFIMITGQSAASDSPYVLGCVSRVRLDHLTMDQLNGLNILIDSCLGVADHITQICSSAYGGYPIKVFHNNWTPKVYKGTTMTRLAQKGFGSWADDPYWGTDKFWFFEDCTFSGPNPNIADNEEGARVVIRHCTINGGGGTASHGMEGRANPGIKQQEVYNNYLITNRLYAQHRSGTALWFNNLSTACSTGLGFYIYRQTRTEANWGTASGTNRYDNNAGGSPIYTGTVTATNGTTSITDNNRADFNLINMSDGCFYAATNLDDPAGSTQDPGWKYKQAGVNGVSGKTLNLVYEAGSASGSTYGNFSAHWAVGHHYEIRKVLALYGQPGQGKGNLLNPDPQGANSYVTYTWPATGGAKATYPQAGYPLEPCYAWNNTDNANGQLGFDSPGGKNRSLKADRDYFNKGEITPLVTQSVGYPPVNYARATANYPGIGPSGTTPYKPYTYPHPLVTGTTNTAPAPSPPTNLQIVP